MGFGDKFKDLKKQAQKSVAEHRDQIEDAVGAAGMVVDKKTKGRHTQRIAKFGQKASQAVDKFADEDEAEAGATPGAPQGATPGAPQGATPGAPQGATPGAPQGANQGATPGATQSATPGATSGESSPPS